MAKINIIPLVKEYIDYNERIKFTKLKVDSELTEYQKCLLNNYLDDNSKFKLVFNIDESLSKEGYVINVSSDYIECKYNSLRGKHNCILTLRQLLINKKDLTTCHIFDEPYFEMRSIMIDISRTKVPTLKTLKKIVDELALVKINDLQLYVEGRSFYFESLDKYYSKKEDFFSGEEARELSKYALERGITLTPNLNCFGHMAFWLNQKDLNHLAMKPEGFNWNNSHARNYAQTINPYNKDAQNLVYTMIDDMLKYYDDVDRCTIGGDEPFELMAPSRNPKAEEIYEYQLKSVINHVHKKGKIPYMWADVAHEYPNMLKSLGEVVLLDWCYEAKWVEENRFKIFQEYQVPFVVCPGTSGWSSFAGKMDNMFKNIEKYVEYGKKYGTLGMILTDWNDGGSMTQVVTNLTCYVYGACYEWSGKVDYSEVNNYLNKYVFKNEIAQSVIDLGNTYLMQDETNYSYSKLFNMYFSHQIDGLNFDIGSYSDCAALTTNREILNYEESERTKVYLDKWINELKITKENDYTKELMFAYRLTRHALNLNMTYLRLRDYNASIYEVKELLNDLESIIKEYKKIWFKRNKESDFKLSNYRMVMLKNKYKNLISLMEDINRLKGE